MHRRIKVAVVAALVLSAASVAGSPAMPVSAADTFQYPSSACPVNGDHGLQDCIDAAAPGDTIVLTSEINPDGPVVINKSLTLRATDRSLEPQLPFIGISESGAPVDVTIQDVRVRSWVRVNFGTTPGGHTVTLRRLTVGRDDPNSNGITFDTQSPASFTLEGSYVRNRGGSGADALHLFAEDPDGPVDINVTGNRLTTRGNSASSSGIQLSAIGDGTLRTKIHNNSIWDVGRCRCGAAAGIGVVMFTGQMRADVDIVGNTIDLSQTDGIQERNSLTGDGRLTLDVFDNIISHTDGFAMRLDSGAPGTFRFRAGHNARFKTSGLSLDGQSAGSGNQSSDPRFVDRASGNLKLRSSSPLIDKGVVCSPGGIANRDAAGHGRLKGSSVDMGAYEYGAGSPSGKAFVGNSSNNVFDGTSGADILCGYGGRDTLRGKGGNDWLDGGSDKDTIVSGSGADRAFGGSGNDTICANDGVHGNDRSDGDGGSDKGRTDTGDTRISIESNTSC